MMFALIFMFISFFFCLCCCFKSGVPILHLPAGNTFGHSRASCFAVLGMYFFICFVLCFIAAVGGKSSFFLYERHVAFRACARRVLHHFRMVRARVLLGLLLFTGLLASGKSERSGGQTRHYHERANEVFHLHTLSSRSFFSVPLLKLTFPCPLHLWRHNFWNDSGGCRERTNTPAFS